LPYVVLRWTKINIIGRCRREKGESIVKGSIAAMRVRANSRRWGVRWTVGGVSAVRESSNVETIRGDDNSWWEYLILIIGSS
jgi:hypothetical protein